MLASRASGFRLRRIEATLQTSRSRLSSPVETTMPVPAPTPVSVLSCIRDYFAGVAPHVIEAKMRGGGMEPELIRYYTEDIFSAGESRAGRISRADDKRAERTTELDSRTDAR